MTGTRSLEGCPLENSHAFQESHEALKKQPIAVPEDRDEYMGRTGTGRGHALNLEEGTARAQPTAASPVRTPPDLRDLSAFDEAKPCDGLFRKGADMLAGSQSAQFARANQLKRKRNTITIKYVSTVLQLAAVVLATLFLAGIAAPSFLRSGAAESHAVASGSLHTLTIAHIPFTYTFWNLASAILGALFGAAAVLAMSSPASPGSSARIGRVRAKCLGNGSSPAEQSRPSYISGCLMK